jgi:hypothetical protein
MAPARGLAMTEHPTKSKFKNRAELPAIKYALKQAAIENRVDLDKGPKQLSTPTKTDEAAKSTVEALMYVLRTFGLAALAGPNCRRRLGELTEGQLGEVIERLIAMRTRYPAITDELLFQLGEQLS